MKSSTILAPIWRLFRRFFWRPVNIQTVQDQGNTGEQKKLQTQPTEFLPSDTKITPRTYRTRGKQEARNTDIWLPSTAQQSTRKPRNRQAPKRERKTEPETPDGDAGFNFRREGVEDAGTFYFRGSLLNDLPKYFRSLRRLRGADPDVYHLCSTIGMTLLPARMIGILCDLPSYWRDPKTRPSFGAASFAEHVDESDNMLRLVYFQRMEIPSVDIEPTNGEVYSVTYYFDDDNTESHKKHRAPKWMRKHGFCVKYHVGVDSNGEVTLLKQQQIRHQYIHYRAGQHAPSNRATNPHNTNGNHTRKMHFTQKIPTKLWDYPEFLREWHKERFSFANDAEMADYYARSFNMIASFANANDMGVRVAITDRDGMAASFALDIKRSAYFFKDRDTVITNDGKKARIFHVVRPHTRHLKDGKTLDLKMHFRGLRRFRWAGYDVHITMPGLHHTPIIKLMPNVSDFEAAQVLGRDKDLATTKEVGKLLHDYLDRA